MAVRKRHAIIITDIAAHAAEFSTTYKAYDIVSKECWISLLHKNQFDMVEMQKIDDFIFDNLDHFLIFWEAASNGKFQRWMLSAEGYAFLMQKYPSQIAVFGEATFNVVAAQSK